MAALQHIAVIGYAECHRCVLFDKQDRDPLTVDALDRFERLLDQRRREAR
jgi:hypothetical protein